MCGSAQINGHVFCEGLKKLELSSLQAMIGPVAFLIKGALFRPKYEPGSRGNLTIGELIGMYSSHDATEQHDKVYALLGLSAGPITTALKPNYDLPWHEIFQRVTNHIFPECSVETWSEADTAVVKGKGRILGHINSVRNDMSEFGQQNVKFLFNDIAQALGYQNEWETNWELQASAQSFQDGDIICLLQGASKPSIVRICKDHFTMITPAVTPQPKRYGESSNEISQKIFYGWLL